MKEILLYIFVGAIVILAMLFIGVILSPLAAIFQ